MAATGAELVEQLIPRQNGGAPSPSRQPTYAKPNPSSAS
jgi:hypothetical protein